MSTYIVANPECFAKKLVDLFWFRKRRTEKVNEFYTLIANMHENIPSAIEYLIKTINLWGDNEDYFLYYFHILSHIFLKQYSSICSILNFQLA